MLKFVSAIKFEIIFMARLSNNILLGNLSTQKQNTRTKNQPNKAIPKNKTRRKKIIQKKSKHSQFFSMGDF